MWVAADAKRKRAYRPGRKTGSGDGTRLRLDVEIGHPTIEVKRDLQPASVTPEAEEQGLVLLMLPVRRNYTQQMANLARGVMHEPLGFELVGQTLLCIGFGASARELSQRADAFGIRVVATEEPPARGQRFSRLRASSSPLIPRRAPMERLVVVPRVLR